MFSFLIDIHLNCHRCLLFQPSYFLLSPVLFILSMSVFSYLALPLYVRNLSNGPITGASAPCHSSISPNQIRRLTQRHLRTDLASSCSSAVSAITTSCAQATPCPTTTPPLRLHSCVILCLGTRATLRVSRRGRWGTGLGMDVFVGVRAGERRVVHFGNVYGQMIWVCNKTLIYIFRGFFGPFIQMYSCVFLPLLFSYLTYAQIAFLNPPNPFKLKPSTPNSLTPPDITPSSLISLITHISSTQVTCITRTRTRIQTRVVLSLSSFGGERGGLEIGKAREGKGRE